MEKLFVYGTLLDPEIQLKVFGREVDGAPARLNGYKKMEITVDSVRYPALTIEPDGTVDGTVLEVTDEELTKADEYEGSEYKRVKVCLSTGEEAWTYVVDV